MRVFTIVLPIMVLCGVVCFTGPAVGTTITVDGSGSGDELTIQAGIDAAGPGDTVLVLAGTYTGPGNRDISCGGTNLVLLSQGGSAVTTVDCESAGRGFIFEGCEDTTSVVRGFTIANAAADSGAGAFCTKGSNPRFESCVFSDNAAEMRGGGLCCVNSSPTIRDCRFEGNTADLGSGSAYGGGMACLDGSTPLVTDTRFELNVAMTGGGGLFSDDSSPSCVRCEFVENNLISYGNGGGGANLAHSDGTSFLDCTFRENGTTQTIVGAGLYVSSSSVTVTDCAFMDNTAGSSGGAHFLYGSSGTVSGCTFSGNVTTWGSATAGLGCYQGSNLTITDCTFANNAGDHIGCNISSPTIEYCILAFSDGGGPVCCNQGTETPHVHHCFVFGNAATDTLCGGNFHDIENADPRFCDMDGQVYSLCQDSPCLAGVTWTALVGAHSQGCPPCGSAVKPESWGAIKAIYR